LRRKHDLGVSPATIRNEMADLEETGIWNSPMSLLDGSPSDQRVSLLRGFAHGAAHLLAKTEVEKIEKHAVGPAAHPGAGPACSCQDFWHCSLTPYLWLVAPSTDQARVQAYPAGLLGYPTPHSGYPLVLHPMIVVKNPLDSARSRSMSPEEVADIFRSS